jgi:hypothetical protein
LQIHAADAYPCQSALCCSLDRAIEVCHAAIKARKPEGQNETEHRHALLYDHASNFDGSDEEKLAILAEALLVKFKLFFVNF